MSHADPRQPCSSLQTPLRGDSQQQDAHRASFLPTSMMCAQRSHGHALSFNTDSRMGALSCTPLCHLKLTGESFLFNKYGTFFFLSFSLLNKLMTAEHFIVGPYYNLFKQSPLFTDVPFYPYSFAAVNCAAMNIPGHILSGTCIRMSVQ